MVNKYHKKMAKEEGGMMTKIYNATFNKSKVRNATTDIRNTLEGNKPSKVQRKYRQKKNPRN